MEMTRAVLTGIVMSMALLGCAAAPNPYKGVTGFEKEKYLGKWYEIARLDFSFERNLNNTTAEYGVGAEGKISVLNKGYNTKKSKWDSAKGKAQFRGADSIGELEVSFFGPFYGQYNVIALDTNYQHALVAGKNTDYLWILSRTRSIPPEVRAEYLGIAHRFAFDTTKLIWVEHDR